MSAATPDRAALHAFVAKHEAPQAAPTDSWNGPWKRYRPVIGGVKA